MVVLFATRSPVWPAIAAAHSVEKKIQIHDAVCFVSNNEVIDHTHEHCEQRARFVMWVYRLCVSVSIRFFYGRTPNGKNSKQQENINTI